MRKAGLLIFTIIISMVLIVTGCGGDETTTQPTATTTTATTSTSTSVTTTATTTATTTSTTTTSAGGPVSGGTLRYIVDQAPTGSLGNPDKMGGSQLYMAAVTEALIMADATGAATPLLAESWEWSDDMLTVTLNLRQGVKFHDGSDFNADVALWNLQQRMASGGLGTANMASVSKTGDYQIEIVTKKFDNTWFTNLRGTLGMMIPKDYVESNTEEFVDFNPVGAGPFKFKEYVENDHLTFVRNDNYWGKKPYLDAVTFMIIVDGTTARLAFENGEADILGSVAGGGRTANQLKERGFAVTSRPGGLSIALVPSVTNPNSPFANVKVRMAAEYAINKEKLAQTVGQGYYNAWYQLAGGSQSAFDPNFQGRVYDVEKAQELLEEAGYGNGFKTKLICGTNLAGDELPLIQADLAVVGIDAEIQTVSINEWIDHETNGWPEGLLESPMAFTELYGIDVNRYFRTPAAPNWSDGIYWDSLYRTAELEALCQEYFNLPLGEEETAKAREIVQWLFDNCSFIPLWDAEAIAVRQNWVKDMALPLAAGPVGWDYWNTWIEPHD